MKIPRLSGALYIATATTIIALGNAFAPPLSALVSLTDPSGLRHPRPQYGGGTWHATRMAGARDGESTSMDVQDEESTLSTLRGDDPATRRQCLVAAASSMGLLAGVASAAGRESPKPPPRARLPDDDTQGSDYMELGGGSKSFAKPRIRYSDFETLKSGLQYKDGKIGSGTPAAEGCRVVMDWAGYTIGYNGGMFETTKGIKGGGFDEEQTAYRFVMGKGTVIPGLEEGIAGMKPGGVRQIIVPPELGYPEDDLKHERVGPKPSTFSGYRTLDFVLSNPGFIDKTLLFTVRVIRVDKPGERGFRGG